MALLIDGYNLLHVTGIFGAAGPGTDLHRTRLALLNFLAASIDERERSATTIVFDAAGAPPGLPRTMHHEGMTIHFARRHSDADEMIEDLLEQSTAPRALVVVSSDHRVQRAARHRGASYVDSKSWYEELRAVRRNADASAEIPTKTDRQHAPGGAGILATRVWRFADRGRYRESVSSRVRGRPARDGIRKKARPPFVREAH